MFCSVSADTREVFALLLPLIPAVLYSMGLMEGKKGRVFFLAGLLSHALVLTLRGVALGTLPVTEKHDTISVMSFSTAALYLFVTRKALLKELSLLAMPLSAVIMVIAVFHTPVNTISPLFDTPWFYFHSLLFFLSYGFFGISFCLGLLYLAGMDSSCELLQYRTALAGWVLYTLSLAAGSVWFYIAYGTYWIWTSRELWAALSWFFFSLYLHARMLKGMRNRPAAVLGVLGYAVVLFAYFGVGTVIPSPPTQF